MLPPPQLCTLGDTCVKAWVMCGGDPDAGPCWVSSENDDEINGIKLCGYMTDFCSCCCLDMSAVVIFSVLYSEGETGPIGELAREWARHRKD